MKTEPTCAATTQSDAFEDIHNVRLVVVVVRNVCRIIRVLQSVLH